MSGVRKFTQQVQKNGGDFTLGFWAKATGQMSLVRKGKYVSRSGSEYEEFNTLFMPQVTFFAQTSPPQHNLRFGLAQNTFGDVIIDSSCDDATPLAYDNVPIPEQKSTDGWQFFSVTFKNTTSKKCEAAANLLKGSEAGIIDLCFWNPESMFTAIELNYAMLISPIMMIPKALPFANVQQVYLKVICFCG